MYSPAKRGNARLFSFFPGDCTVVSENQNPFRLNVGFIIHQSVGYVRDFEFEFAHLNLSPDLELFDISGTIRVTRTGQGLLVQANLQAEVEAECVRCLSDFRQPLEIDFTELYAFTPDSLTESGLLVPETGKIDLTPLVRDEFLLAVPISPICKADCLGLCPVCGENRNLSHCEHEEEPADPRLSVLKSLLEKKD